MVIACCSTGAHGLTLPHARPLRDRVLVVRRHGGQCTRHDSPPPPYPNADRRARRVPDTLTGIPDDRLRCRTVRHSLHTAKRVTIPAVGTRVPGRQSGSPNQATLAHATRTGMCYAPSIVHEYGQGYLAFCSELDRCAMRDTLRRAGATASNETCAHHAGLFRGRTRAPQP